MSAQPLTAVAAAGPSPLVHDLGVCLAVAAGLVLLCQRIRIPTIAAYLAAGVLIGPVGLELVSLQASVEAISHLGLTLLLFVIGIELDLRSLLTSGRPLLAAGLLQVPLSVALGWVVFAGIAGTGMWTPGPYAPLYLGLACAFSSTLIVVRLLQGHLQLDTVAGRFGVGLLIFQDLWAIVVLAIQPDLASPELAPIAATFAGIGVIAAVAAVASRTLLPWAFRVVAGTPELVLVAALGWCFALGLLAAHLGPLTVSIEIAALIAGAAIAALPYSAEVVARVTHLRDFFIVLFFVGLGMGIPLPSSVAPVLLGLLLAAVAIALRYVVFLPLLLVGRLDRQHAFEISTKLAQVSEFCLIIVYLGVRYAHVTADAVITVMTAFVVTALVTPAVFDRWQAIYRRAAGVLDRLGLPAGDETPEPGHGPPPRIVLLGFHRLAAALLHELRDRAPRLLRDTLVVDLNVAVHDRIHALGARTLYADFMSMEALQHARVDDASVIVLTLTDELMQTTTAEELVPRLRVLAPGARLCVCASRQAETEALRAAGADFVFTTQSETARSILPAIEAALSGRLPTWIAARRRRVGPVDGREELID